MGGSPISKWSGFEFLTEGCLLEQVIEMDSAMGIAYERSVGFYKDYHVHDRLMLVVPRGSCVVEIRTSQPRQRHLVNSDTVLLIPSGLEHDDQSLNPIYDTLALYPSEDLVNQTLHELKLTSEEENRLQTGCHKILKSSGLDHLIQEYFYERVVSKQNTKKLQNHFIEKKLVIEALRILFDKEVTLVKRPSKNGDIVTLQALRFIESNLFQKITLELIAEKSGVSVSTFLRKFKVDTGHTPYSYIKARRLDEAMRLIKTTSNSIGQIAMLVGYENFGAFSEAFKHRFGTCPSEIVKNKVKDRKVCDSAVFTI